MDRCAQNQPIVEPYLKDKNDDRALIHFLSTRLYISPAENVAFYSVESKIILVKCLSIKYYVKLSQITCHERYQKTNFSMNDFSCFTAKN